MNDITISAEWIKYGGFAMSMICFLVLVFRNWSGISGLFAKIPLPGGEGLLPSSEPADPRTALMRDWEDITARLVQFGADESKFKEADDEAWATIRKAKVSA